MFKLYVYVLYVYTVHLLGHGLAWKWHVFPPYSLSDTGLACKVLRSQNYEDGSNLEVSQEICL